MDLAEVVRQRIWNREAPAGAGTRRSEPTERARTQLVPFAWGAVGGAAAAHFLDPDRGRRRRARMRDRSVRVAKKMERAIDAAKEDVANRSRGMVAEARGRLRHEEVDDELLVERVRATLGQVVTHPSSIEVEAKGGVILLRGVVLGAEVRRLRHAVRRVPGVLEVEDQLEVHEQRGDVPGLQGSGRLPRRGRSWSPRTRALTLVSGAAAALYGLQRRDAAVGRVAAAAGCTLAARSVTNLPVRSLVGVRARRRAIDIEKTINIEAPVERVFEFWTNYENFPEFMAHVREVKEVGGDRSRWTIDGPAGVPVKFDAEVSAFRPNEVFAWRSVEGSAIEHSGIVRFQPTLEGTRVQVRMTYNPVAGAIGHAVASLLGSNPKQRMDDDLMRLKSLLETGKRPSDASRSERE